MAGHRVLLPEALGRLVRHSWLHLQAGELLVVARGWHSLQHVQHRVWSHCLPRAQLPWNRNAITSLLCNEAVVIGVMTWFQTDLGLVLEEGNSSGTP